MMRSLLNTTPSAAEGLVLLCCRWTWSYLLKLRPSSTTIHRMGESCVQGLGRFTVVGTFPFSDFHETTEQTKMASLIQFNTMVEEGCGKMILNHT